MKDVFSKASGCSQRSWRARHDASSRPSCTAFATGAQGRAAAPQPCERDHRAEDVGDDHLGGKSLAGVAAWGKGAGKGLLSVASSLVCGLTLAMTFGLERRS